MAAWRWRWNAYHNQTLRAMEAMADYFNAQKYCSKWKCYRVKIVSMLFINVLTAVSKWSVWNKSPSSRIAFAMLIALPGAKQVTDCRLLASNALDLTRRNPSHYIFLRVSCDCIGQPSEVCALHNSYQRCNTYSWRRFRSLHATTTAINMQISEFVTQWDWVSASVAATKFSSCLHSLRVQRDSDQAAKF